MALFNTLIAAVACPSCGAEHDRRVQYRYGRTWQLETHLGDEVEWGVGAVGEAGHNEVIVAGWIDSCPSCSFEGDCEVVVRNDLLVGVRAWSAAPGLVLGEDFEVID